VTEEAILIIAVLIGLLALALCAVVILALTLPERVARLVEAGAVRDAGGMAASRALVRQLADTATAHREILAEQADVAAAHRGLAQWLVDAVLRGRRRPLPRPGEHLVAGGSRQPDQPPTPDAVQAGRAGCRLAPTTLAQGRRVVIPGPWTAHAGQGVERGAAGGGETDDAS
jgi:hypothetical protein